MKRCAILQGICIASAALLMRASVPSPLGDWGGEPPQEQGFCWSEVLTTHQISRSPEFLYRLAQAMTVKVLVRDSWGSGVLIRRRENVYSVVTNEHVLLGGQSSFSVQTLDGKVHAAVETWRSPNVETGDVALLEFQSESEYPVARLGKLPAVGCSVFAAGFPERFNPRQAGNGFQFTRGKVSWILDKVLEGGYQLGYTNAVEKGMSGGPVLNTVGEVVAINGIHPHPLWDAPYIYQDGSEASPKWQKRMEEQSWAVPIDTVLRLVPSINLERVNNNLGLL